VTDYRITAIGPAASVTVSAGARVIDLGDVTLLPGFIDAHTHIIGRTLGDPMADMAVVKDYAGYGAIIGVDNARRTLMAGFTSIRVVGAPNFDDMALRQAITDGRVPGPRMENAGYATASPVVTATRMDSGPGCSNTDRRKASRMGPTRSAPRCAIW
jgi:imidazolonepropionase-like amidohydrolase